MSIFPYELVCPTNPLCPGPTPIPNEDCIPVPKIAGMSLLLIPCTGLTAPMNAANFASIAWWTANQARMTRIGNVATELPEGTTNKAPTGYGCRVGSEGDIISVDRVLIAEKINIALDAVSNYRLASDFLCRIGKKYQLVGRLCDDPEMVVSFGVVRVITNQLIQPSSKEANAVWTFKAAFGFTQKPCDTLYAFKIVGLNGVLGNM